jgi:hypothetical protein
MATHFHSGITSRHRQRGMGATVILFTIALIVLVGAALAYGSRGNTKAFTNESAKVFSSVLLKQSGEYRDAYNRYIFDGGNAGLMTFTNALTVYALFNSNKQYGIEQDPPSKAFASTATTWKYNNTVVVTGVGSSSPDSIVYLTGISPDVCTQINTQMYGLSAIPVESLADASALVAPATPTIASLSYTGRATGCVQLADSSYVFYSTLAEN